MATMPQALPGESWLSRRFEFAKRSTSLATELWGGLTTFLVMAYIVFVNPAILSTGQLAGKGPDFAATLTVTCLMAGLLSIAMGWFANYPFAMAPGMGLNAVVATQLILNGGFTWQEAMGVIFLEGVFITVLMYTGFREAVMHAIPLELKRAIAVGIGLFIMFIGFNNAGLVRAGEGTPVTLGNLTSFPILLAVVGLALTLFFMARGFKAALLLGIITTTILGVVSRYAFGYDISATPGDQGLLPTTVTWPDFSSIGQGINIGVFLKLGFVAGLLTIFSLMLSDFFDTMGTVVGLGEQAGLVDEQGRLPGIDKVLKVDSWGALLGGFAGSSSNTTYIESSAGILAGARTGLAAIVVGVLFLLSMLLAPIAGLITAEATAPALILIGFLMFAAVRDLDWSDLEVGFPALLTVVLMPFTYSITNGIGAGILSYVFMKVVRGKGGDLNLWMWIVAAAFLVYFLLPALGF